MIPMMIVLIGLYQALIHLSCDPVTAATTSCDPTRSDEHFVGPWLWISQLGHPDIPVHIGTVPIPGVLPVVMLATQFLYGKLTPTAGNSDDPQQQMMGRMTTYFMPLMLFFFSFNFPAGLVLYWTISNIFEIVRMGVTVGWDPIRPATLMASFGGAQALLGRPTVDTSPSKRPSVPRDGEEPDEPVNPPPGRPPGGSRRKKGKRGGKR
jgi:YidC/Oxa1 family membrane protein insertase